MANADTPNGLRPFKNMDGTPYNGATMKCSILAANTVATFVGDLVVFEGSASVEGYPSVAQGAAASTSFAGVVTSFDHDPNDLSLVYRKASTLRNCNVALASNVIFVIQADGALLITDVGDKVDVIVAAGSTVTGLSAMELKSSDIGTGANLLILGIDERPDNAFGTNADVVVRINEHSFGAAGTSV